MRRGTAGALTIAALALGAPAAAEACSRIGPPPSAKERFDGARKAVVGRVTSVRFHPSELEPDAVFMGVRVQRTYKGRGGRWLRLRSGLGGGDCTPGPLEVGRTYGLLLSSRDRGGRFYIFDDGLLPPGLLRRIARRT